ncbi:hypothetical protein PSCT_00599 [Pseudomonas sp. SCT]|nr:hypothetical protein PSCT_00599 [Pseudomonas sp. SCT]
MIGGQGYAVAFHTWRACVHAALNDAAWFAATSRWM